MKVPVAALLVCAAAMVGSAAPAHAQSTRADSVIHFVESFLSNLVFSGQERPIVRLAALPSRVPAELEIPAGVDIVGSVEFESLSFVILGTSRPSEASAAIRGTLEAGGWVLRPDDPPDTQFGADSEVQPLTFCRDELSVGLSSDEDEGRVSLFFMTNEAMSPCTLPERVQGVHLTTPIPPLRRPAGAESRGGRGGGGDNEWYQSFTLATSLPLDELKRHYVDQLQGYGAEIGSSADTEEAVVVTFRFPAVDGEHWRGTLTLSGDSAKHAQYVHIFLVR